MPLPIETPAPKASSLIKRFQQNIDQSDEKPAPLLPKQRLSIGPDDPAYRRRSWAVGSGGAALPQTEVLWRGRQVSSGSASGYSNTSSPQLHASPSSRVLSGSNQDGSPSQPPGSQLQIDPSLSPPSGPRLETIPPTPIDQSSPMINRPNLSNKTSDHSSIHSQKSSVPPTENVSRTNSPTKARMVATSATPSPLDQPDFRPRAAVLAEIRAPRTRKVTNSNVTAPTAASLAKIRSADGSHTPPSVALPSPSLRGRTDSLSRNNSTGHSLPKAKPESIIGNPSSLGLSPSKSITRKVTSPLGKGPQPATRRSTAAQPQSFQRLPSSPSRPSNTSTERMRAASSAPKSRTRVDSLGSTTTHTNTGKRVASTVGSSTTKPKPSPPIGIPPFGAGPGLRAQAKSPTPRKARTNLSHLSGTTPVTSRPTKASVTPTSHPTKPETRPASRARVASIATPVSIKRPPTSAPKSVGTTSTPNTGTTTKKISEGVKTPKTPTGTGTMTKPSTPLPTPSKIPRRSSPKSSTDSKTPKGSKSPEETEASHRSAPEEEAATINTLEFPSIPDELDLTDSPKPSSQPEPINPVESTTEHMKYMTEQQVISSDSSTEEGSCNTTTLSDPHPSNPSKEAPEEKLVCLFTEDDSIAIVAESSASSNPESLGEREGKKRSKRRSGIAAW